MASLASLAWSSSSSSPSSSSSSSLSSSAAAAKASSAITSHLCHCCHCSSVGHTGTNHFLADLTVQRTTALLSNSLSLSCFWSGLDVHRKVQASFHPTAVPLGVRTPHWLRRCNCVAGQDDSKATCPLRGACPQRNENLQAMIEVNGNETQHESSCWSKS